MKAASDFNYKVALASGLKHLQAGKLRQAEEQFRYLVSKFPRSDGGYRGLAKVQLEGGDRAGALATLRDGAASLSRAGDRTTGIDLLREAVRLDPLDLASHRRLAAALAIAGDVAAASAEYERFARAELAAGDAERARLETTYALETLGEIPALHELARSVGVELRTVRGQAEATEAPAPEVPSPRIPADDPRLAMAAQWAASRPASVPERVATAQAAVHAPEPSAAPKPPPAAEPPLPPAAVAPAAPAAHPAIAEARALAAAGKVYAASDLLLQLIASGVAVHEAERELIPLTRALGRDDLAAERERLIAEAERDG